MITLEAFKEVSSLTLENFKPKPTSSTKGQLEAIQLLWESNDGKTQIGIWECTPGNFTADRSKTSEYCKILSGTATVQDYDCKNERFIQKGDLLILPVGWIGNWTIHTQLKKLFIISK
jgi:uncharacterized cupin superfamily protein